MTSSPRLTRALLAVPVVSCLACGGAADTGPPVATPTVTMERRQVAIGTPVEMRYRFVVASDAPAFGEDYWVFVHFLDSDGELMWTDDHQPPMPTSAWKPGAAVEYARTMFVPKYPYAGLTVVEVGLYSTESGERLRLDAEATGRRAYALASFDLTPRDGTRFVAFKDGWHAAEVDDDDLGTEWQWSTGEATLAFRNPKADAMFYLQLDQPSKVLAEPQEVEVRIGGAVVDRFALAASRKELRKFRLTRAQLGDDQMVEIRITVNRTFVPAEIPDLNSADPRKLGVRVFQAYVEPR